MRVGTSLYDHYTFQMTQIKDDNAEKFGTVFRLKITVVYVRTLLNIISLVCNKAAPDKIFFSR